MTLCGGRRPLLRGQSPLVKIGIKVTVIVFTEETGLPGTDTLRECFNNVDVGASLWKSEPRDEFSCREFASSHPSLKLPHFILQLVCLYFRRVVS